MRGWKVVKIHFMLWDVDENKQIFVLTGKNCKEYFIEDITPVSHCCVHFGVFFFSFLFGKVTILWSHTSYLVIQLQSRSRLTNFRKFRILTERRSRWGTFLNENQTLMFHCFLEFKRTNGITAALLLKVFITPYHPHTPRVAFTVYLSGNIENAPMINSSQF